MAQPHAPAIAVAAAVDAAGLAREAGAAPAVAPGAANETPGQSPAVRELLARLNHSRGFPALSAAVVRIQQLTRSESENLHTLSTEILKDVALTQKLLRLVNTAHFSHAGAGSIGTVSRAVALIGLRGVRDLALSLVLLEHLPDSAQVRLREEYLRALVAAALAGDLSNLAHTGEEAFVGTLFQGLGRLLVSYYCPADAERIRLLAPGPSVLQRDAASLQVLGATLSQIGLAVARDWGLPEDLQRCMSVPEAEQPPRRAAPAGAERLRWLGRAAHELAEILLTTGGDRPGPALLPTAQRYAPVLDVAVDDILAAVERLRLVLPQWARALGLESALHGGGSPSAPAAPRRGAPVAAAPAPDPSAQSILTAGVQDLTEALLADPGDLDAVLRMWVEVVWRALRAQHVVLCLRDDGRDELVARHALGLESPAALTAFRVPLAHVAHDPFARLCLHGADTLVADVRGGEIAARLPAWFRTHYDAGTLLLMPLLHKARPLGLLYADRAAPHGLELGDREWPLLRTLRNQVLLALRHR